MTVYAPPRKRDCNCRSRATLGALDTDNLLQILASSSRAIDPDLPDVVNLTREVIAIERRPGGLLDPSTPSTFRIVDLKKPLHAYLFYRKHPWILYAIPLGILGLAFAIGRASR